MQVQLRNPLHLLVRGSVRGSRARRRRNLDTFDPLDIAERLCHSLQPIHMERGLDVDRHAGSLGYSSYESGWGIETKDATMVHDADPIRQDRCPVHVMGRQKDRNPLTA
ncbi:MAG: hypothetical protein ACRDYB_04410 [Acidimicrobiales bacterium]